MDDAKINAIVDAVVRELLAAKALQSASQAAAVPAPVPPAAAAPPAVAPAPRPAAPQVQVTPPSANGKGLTIDLPDPTGPEMRTKPGIKKPLNPDALDAMIASTTARIGVGRAGPRYRTASLLLFQADHAVTQDALLRDVDQKLLDEFGLFTVQTCIT